MRALAALVAALAFAGCGGGGRPAAPTPSPGPPAQRAPEPPSDEQQIEDVLRDRAEALEAGNRRAYLMTSTLAALAHDRVAFGRAARLGLRDVAYEAGSMTVTARRARVHVTERYSIAGVRGRYETARPVELVKTAGRWRVAAERGSRGLPPWDVAPFAVRRTRHFVVLVPPRTGTADLLTALEDGYGALRARLRQGRLRRRYLVVVAGDPGQARALTREIQGLGSLAAIADATINERGPARKVAAVVSLRLLVIASSYGSLVPEGRRRTIAHELTHAALAGETSGRTPAWLVEGVAMYVAGDRRPAPPGSNLAALSQPAGIARLSGAAQANAYAASSAAAFAIVDRFGADRLLELYDAFNDPSLAGEPGPRLVNRALRRELGISLGDVTL